MLQLTTASRRKPPRQVIRELRCPATLELLERLFLHESQESIKVTFIALDFEYLSRSGDSITEVGISTLSTDDIWQSAHPLGNTIQSRRYITSKPSSCQPFLFGESKRILRRDIPELLKEAISMKSQSPIRTPGRVVLVGHHISAEIDIMEKLGINLLDPNLFSIEGIVDTSRIATGLDLPFSEDLPSLGKVLELSQVPFHKSYLHNAGNDAHFTLRALLMLTAMALEKMELGELQKDRISRLQSIALDPIDFDRLALEVRRKRTEENVRKGATLRGPKLGNDHVDVWGCDEEECLGGTLFEMDADT